MAIAETRPATKTNGKTDMNSRVLLNSFAENGWGRINWTPRDAMRAKIAALGSYMKEIAQESAEARDFIGMTALHNETMIRMRRSQNPERISVASIEPHGPDMAEVRVDRLTGILMDMSCRLKLGKDVPSMVQHMEVFVRTTH